MKNPSDEELLRFIATFAGWHRLHMGKVHGGEDGSEYLCGFQTEKETVFEWSQQVPDYLHDLNAWHRDVWPKISTLTVGRWMADLRNILKDGAPSVLTNADACYRCLALWRALDGKLPDRSES